MPLVIRKAIGWMLFLMVWLGLMAFLMGVLPHG